jgi:ankyrin repeat protein
VRDSKGYTPLILASQYNQVPLVIFLIGKGVLLDIEDNNGDNALHWVK